MCGEEQPPSWQQKYYESEGRLSEKSRTAELSRRSALKMLGMGIVGIALSSCSKRPEGTTLRAGIDNGENSLDAYGNHIKIDDKLLEKSDDAMNPYLKIEYVVKPNQTLRQIAGYFFTDPRLGEQSIMAASGIADPAAVVEGTKLLVWITDPESPVYEKDVTSRQMAETHFLPAEAIALLNGLRMNDIDIEIPAREEVVVVLPKQRAVRDKETAYIVQPSDVGTSYTDIAKKNNVDPIAIRQANVILDGSFQPGQIIALPQADHPALQPEAPTPPPAPTPDVLKTNPTPPSPELPGPERLKQFISTYRPFAEHVQAVHGVPTAVVLAMAQHESDYGNSELAKSNAYNFHGLKANNGWKGPVYEKKTREEYSEEAYQREKAAGNIVADRGKNKNGLYDVDIIGKFRKFPSVLDGFLGYGEKLKSEGNYPDAFDYPDDPLKFFDKLIDDNGPKYATDSDYQKKVRARIEAVQAVLSDQSKPPEQAPAHEADSPVGRIEAVKVSVEGYENFKANLDKSLIETLKKLKPFRGYPTDEFMMFVLHFTVGRYKSAEAFADQIASDGKAVQFFIKREGERDSKTSELTDLDARVAHCKPHNRISIGAEVEAKNQAEIVTAQYRDLIYTAAYVMKEHDMKLDEATVNKIVVGHAEIRAADIRAGRVSAKDGRSDFPKAESDAVRRKIIELGTQLDAA